MSKYLEFHYVVSYQEGIGWQTSPELDQALFGDGSVYDHSKHCWDVAIEDVETLDNSHFQALNLALIQLNEGNQNA